VGTVPIPFDETWDCPLSTTVIDSLVPRTGQRAICMYFPSMRQRVRGNAMNMSRLTVSLCFAALCVAPTSGEDRAPGGQRCCVTPRCCCPPPIAGCPDDYCRKPAPCTPCLPPGSTCDDYCRKPIPCVPCLPGCGVCDDYCRKPLPNFCWPALDGLRCVSSSPKCDLRPCEPIRKPKLNQDAREPASAAGVLFQSGRDR
jgi:hypothetical protein